MIVYVIHICLHRKAYAKCSAWHAACLPLSPQPSCSSKFSPSTFPPDIKWKGRASRPRLSVSNPVSLISAPFPGTSVSDVWPRMKETSTLHNTVMVLVPSVSQGARFRSHLCAACFYACMCTLCRDACKCVHMCIVEARRQSLVFPRLCVASFLIQGLSLAWRSLSRISRVLSRPRDPVPGSLAALHQALKC